MNPAAVKAAMQKLAADAQEVVASKSLSTAEKKSALERIESEIQTHTDALIVDSQVRQLAGFGNSLYGADGGLGVGLGVKSYGGPSLRPSEAQVKAMQAAASSKQSLKIEVDTKALDLDSSIPAGLSPGIIAFRREPTRVASLFPNAAMTGPSIEYVRHASSTGAAGMVAAGGEKPEITVNTDTVTAVARKIAGHIGVVDESLQDFGAVNGYISGELFRACTAVENTQLLSGDGTGVNLEGILSTTGVLTRTQAASPETPIDTLELALTDLRNGESFTEATGFVMNPTDWSAIRLLKNSYNEYLLGHPAEGDPSMLWGKPVVLTTDCPAKTVLAGNFEIGGAVLIRQGFTLETQSSGTDWTSNITRFRGEERIALAIYRPSAFIKVTLL